MVGELEKRVIIPSAFLASDGNSDLGRLLVLQQVQCEAAQAAEVLRPVTLANPSLILSKTHVQLPVQIVLHAPMAANISGQTFGPGPPVQRTDVIMQFHADLSVHVARSFHENQTLEARPLPGQLAQPTRLPANPHAACLDAAMAAIGL